MSEGPTDEVRPTEDDPTDQRPATAETDEEYSKVRQYGDSMISMIDVARHDLDRQIDQIQNQTLRDLLAERSTLEGVRNTTDRAKKVIHCSDKFLKDDVTGALKALRESLDKYSQTIVDKLRADNPNGIRDQTGGDDATPNQATEQSQAAQQAAEAREKLTRLAVELKELEIFSTQIEEEVNRQAHLDETNVSRADSADRDLDGLSDNANKQSEEEKEKEEAERRMREEEERSRKEAEEQERLVREQQQREEEERLRAEKEARELAEAERLKKEDPRYWPAIIYDSNASDDPLGAGVNCVVRMSPESGTLDKQQLECRSVDWRVNRYPVGENEEIVSQMISVKPSNGREMEFGMSVWIALPFASVSRGRETVIRVQLVKPLAPSEKIDSEKQDDEGEKPVEEPIVSEWSDVLTRDTNVEGQEHPRFVETPIKRLEGDGLNMVVLTRPKRDQCQWNNRGGRLVSSVDSRVSIGAPKNAFRLSTDVSLQVILIDSTAIAGLKERYDGCDMLMGTSPLVGITASGKPLKPLVLSVTNPSGVSKKPKAGGSTSAKNPGSTGASGNTLPKMNSSATGRFGQERDDPDGVVELVVKDLLGRWRHRDGVKMNYQRDCVVFQLPDLVQRLVLLRTSQPVESTDLVRIASQLEMSLVDRPAQLVVRQRGDDPSSVFVELCRRDAVDRLIDSDRLNSLGFNDGPGPSRLVCVREGDLLELSFRDNIEPVQVTDDGIVSQADPARRFLYNSNLSSLNAHFTVRERSAFAQNALDVFRGFVRLCLVERPYLPPPKLVGPSGTSASAGGQTGAGGTGVAKKAAAPVDQNLVVETLLTLPKPPKGTTQINKASFSVAAKGPLTVEYYDQLSESIGGSWLKLAEALNMDRPTVQRIIRAYTNLDEPTTCRRSAKDVLVQWHRSSAKFKSQEQVEQLMEALTKIGRNDLADELNAKNKEYRREIDKKHTDDRLKKSFKVFLDSVAAVRVWQEIGHELGIPSQELAAIGGPTADGQQTNKSKNTIVANNPEIREQAEKMLNKWIELNGEEASTDQLIAALKKHKLDETAVMMQVIK